MLEVENVTGGYGGFPIVQQLQFHVDAGEILGIIGPNGSGKSTLLKLLYGGLKPYDGKVSIQAAPLPSLSQKEIAKQIAVLPQHMENTFSYTVQEVVELGRYPHQKGWFGRDSAGDREKMEEAMRETDVLKFASQTLESLSGGEKQRVFLARALAQEPRVLLLDEPTNHLDISFQVQLLDTLKQWSREKGMTVIAALHDLNIAAIYSDRLLLLDNGRQKALGKPSSVLEKSQLETVYEAKLYRREHPSLPRPQLFLEPRYISETYPSSCIEELKIEQQADYVMITSSIYWKTLSTEIVGPGFGWHSCFLYKRMEEQAEEKQKQQFYELLDERKTKEHETAVMWLPYISEVAASYHSEREPGFAIFIISGGISIFIDGKLTEAAYTHFLVKVVEAVSRACYDKQIQTKGASADKLDVSTAAVLISASQRGSLYQTQESYSLLSTKIAQAVYHVVFDEAEEEWHENQQL
ncbi:ABC transporter ATP-binding protein [Salibacterium aidingense]|uniref:ABC transporter ATP-binding protein n=1 Tax=Salibacterium aidingense TaxID=384933 RepID=UPI003BD350D6